jgi:hypothetical protein
VWLAHIEGADMAVERLCEVILVQPQPLEGPYARALLPPDAPIIPTLQAAGFVETEDHMCVYELDLSANR